jgi:hypothetical protein
LLSRHASRHKLGDGEASALAEFLKLLAGFVRQI